MQFLYFLQQALVWLITVYWIYQLVISLFALVKIKDKPYIVDKKHKFLAIIPAHNEEAVVGSLITSLQDQSYDSKDYDIFVIADNCTDKTEEIAREAGVNVFVRTETDPAKKTKGAALQVFLNTILNIYVKEKKLYKDIGILKIQMIVGYQQDMLYSIGQ